MVRVLAASLLLLLLAGGARAEDDQALYQAAKKEGQIRFGGAMKQKETQEILKVFETRYPGLRVTYTRRSTEPMVQLIEAERLSHKVSLDLVNVTEPGDMVRWKKEGYVTPVEVPGKDKQIAEAHDPDGAFWSLGVTPMVGIYNAKKLAGGAPTSVKELAEEKWRGTLAVSRPSRGGTSTAALMNVVAALGADSVQQMPGWKILLTRGNEAAISSVISGERPLSWGVSGYRAIEAKAEGAPIELLWWKEGVALAHFIAGVTREAPSPNGARLLLRWLLSKEGQELVAQKVELYSVRTDVTATPRGMPPLAQLPIHPFSARQTVDEGGPLAAEFDKVMGLK